MVHHSGNADSYSDNDILKWQIILWHKVRKFYKDEKTPDYVDARSFSKQRFAGMAEAWSFAKDRIRRLKILDEIIVYFGASKRFHWKQGDILINKMEGEKQ